MRELRRPRVQENSGHALIQAKGSSVEDYSVRLLSQGKFTGVVATRSVAESVFLSQSVKALRERNVDLDAAAEASHKGPTPSKISDPLRFFEPLIPSVLKEIRSKVPPETNLNRSTSLQTQKHNWPKHNTSDNDTAYR